MNPLPPTGPARRARPVLHWLLLTLLACAVFTLWPGIDLAVSDAAMRAAGDPERGAPLYAWGQHPLVQASYWSVPTLGRLALLVSLVLWWRRAPASPFWRRWRGRAPWIAAMLVLGVWLLVNEGFKEHWGRPRPGAVATLGGELPFRSIAQPSSLCASNCSFPSGHAAQGYAVMVAGLLAAPHRRRAWLRAGLAAGLLIGAGRVLQGGHFLSDILFAGLMVWGLTLLLRAVAVRLRRRRVQRRSASTGSRDAAVITRSRALSNMG
jgi:membrane-associated PAP2 superfamily phosphatase